MTRTLAPPRTSRSFAESVLDAVRAFPVLELAGREVELRKAGAWHRGPCPLHDGQGANFCVNAETNGFICHVCGGSGSGALDYVQAAHSLPFVDAVRAIAAEAGISLPDDSPSPSLPAFASDPRRAIAPRAARRRYKEQDAPNQGYTLEDLSDEKGVPVDHLKAWGCKETRWPKWEDGRESSEMVCAVEIPHLDADGELIRSQVRLRRGHERPKRWKSDGQGREAGAPPHGLNWISRPDRKALPVLIVEGCTDVIGHSVHARRMGCVALGISGANQWGGKWRTQVLSAIGSRDVLVWLEPPNDPENPDPRRARASLMLLEAVAGDIPGARVIRPELSALPKDLADLHASNPEGYESLLRAAIDSSEPAADVLAELLPSHQEDDRPNAEAPEQMISATPPERPRHQQPNPEPRPAPVVCMTDVQREEIEWLWRPYLPRRKLCDMQGNPGDGKTAVCLDIMARLTTGRPLPGESRYSDPRKPLNVLYWTTEDGLGDTLRPRLEAAGADLSRVFAVQAEDDLDTLSLDSVGPIESALDAVRPAMFVIDPIQGVLGAKVDSKAQSEVRPKMRRLIAWAEKYGCSIVMIRHLSKGAPGGGPAIYRGMGSIDFAAAARSVLLVGRHPDDENRRVLVQIKSSLARSGDGLEFTLEDTGTGGPRVVWGDSPSRVTAEAMLSGVGAANATDEERSAEEEAREWLLHALADGPVAADEVQRLAGKVGIKTRTLNRAKAAISMERGGVTLSRKNGKEWVWQLPPEHPAPRLGHTADDRDDEDDGEDCQPCQHLPTIPVGNLGNVDFSKAPVRESDCQEGCQTADSGNLPPLRPGEEMI